MQKRMGSMSQGLEKKTAAAVKRKGKKVTTSRLTIDAGLWDAIRIKEKKKSPAFVPEWTPVKRPAHQNNASRAMQALRRLRGRSGCHFMCICKNLPQDTQNTEIGGSWEREMHKRHNGPSNQIA